jgi:hypothetical protein
MPKGRLGEDDKRGAHAPDRAGGLSLKDIEQAIRSKTKEKFELRNFLRPTKREKIQSQIDYLRAKRNGDHNTSFHGYAGSRNGSGASCEKARAGK